MMNNNKNNTNIEYKSSYISDFENNDNNNLNIDKYYSNDEYDITELSSTSNISTFNTELNVFEAIDFSIFLQDNILGDFIIKCLLFIKESLNYYLLNSESNKVIPKLHYRKDSDDSDVFTWSYTNYRVTIVFDVNDSFCSIVYMGDDEFISRTKQINSNNYKNVLTKILNLILNL